MARSWLAMGLLMWAGGCASSGISEDELRGRLMSYSWGKWDTNYRPPPPATKEELRILIEQARSYYCPQPDLHGTVVLSIHDERSGRARLAVLLDQNPPKTWPNGIMMALFDAEGSYYGELGIRQLDGRYALGWTEFLKPGRASRVGDHADSKEPWDYAKLEAQR